MTFDEWWDADLLTQTNPYPEDYPVYWAWEGWQAGVSHGKPKFDVCGVVDLEQLWNRTVDEYNKWHTLSCDEKLDFAQAAAITVEREACASKLNLSRAEVSLMAGELSASEWRTIAAVLKGLQARIRNNE